MKLSHYSIFVAWTVGAAGQIWTPQASSTTVSLRGVSVVTSAVVWASGAGGTYLRTLDGGATWQAGTVPDAADLDFRSIYALDSDTAWVMSSGPGVKSRIYRTDDGGRHWALLYTNPDATGFLDALQFWDGRRGAVLGDPVNGRFVVLTTRDGGKSWRRRKLPASLPDEGAFAASNSCLRVRGRREMWFASGGLSGGRVFHSSDGGWHWTVAATGVRHDSAGAGIFSLAFADARHGIAVGGDYGKPAEPGGNVAVTSDAGHTWEIPVGHPAGYRSAVEYLAGHKAWIAVGTSGSDVSNDDGRTWKSFDSGAYNALGVATGDAAWAVGPGGRIGKLQWR